MGWGGVATTIPAATQLDSMCTPKICTRVATDKRLFRLVLIDTGSPLGADWHALDASGATLAQSFRRDVAQRGAEALGYTLDTSHTPHHIIPKPSHSPGDSVDS